jgi:hypothetical protein
MESDSEVERVLQEIRQHLRASAGARGADGGATPARESLALIEADLAITERTWSRLPPIQSERRGWLSRLELWVKRRIKRAAHWFTWEQVNFNAAVNHTLRTAHSVLAAHEAQLAELRAQAAQLAAREQELAELRAEVEYLRGLAGSNGKPVAAASHTASASRAAAAHPSAAAAPRPHRDESVTVPE